MSAPTHVWPVLRYTDARAAIRFLVDAFGFEQAAVSPADPEVSVEHAELRWPRGGGIMLGTQGVGAEVFDPAPGAPATTYVVCTDPDALHDRARAAGAEIVMELTDQSYGSREFTARDPEGNLWSFGTYGGA